MVSRQKTSVPTVIIPIARYLFFLCQTLCLCMILCNLHNTMRWVSSSVLFQDGETEAQSLSSLPKLH